MTPNNDVPFGTSAMNFFKDRTLMTEFNSRTEDHSVTKSDRDSGAPKPAQPTRLIVVDDDEPFAFGISKLLERKGYNVRVATNGRQALEILTKATADVVITDIFMEEMEGLETIVQLRREHPHIRVIAMSGGSCTVGIDCLSLARSLGAKRVLQKPVTIDALEDAIRGLSCG